MDPCAQLTLSFSYRSGPQHLESSVQSRFFYFNKPILDGPSWTCMWDKPIKIISQICARGLSLRKSVLTIILGQYLHRLGGMGGEEMLPS